MRSEKHLFLLVKTAFNQRRKTLRNAVRGLFDPGVLERLALIALGSSAGFSLDEMTRMFSSNGRPNIDRTMLADKAAELERRIRELTVMRDGLRHAVACPAPTHLECPTFRRLLGLAPRGKPLAVRGLRRRARTT